MSVVSSNKETFNYGSTRQLANKDGGIARALPRPYLNKHGNGNSVGLC